MNHIIRKLVLREKNSSDSYIKHLRKIGCSIGEDVTIYQPNHVLIDDTRPWLIQIGNHVRITKNVTILTHGYEWSVIKEMTGEILGSAGKVTIGNNVFIGMNSTIIKNVTIGNNVIIGANSLVTKDIPANSVAAGNPAKVICTVEEYIEKRKKCQEKEAIECVIEYFKKYGSWPKREVLREFIWLFDKRDQTTLDDRVFKEISSLGSGKKTITAFCNSKSKYPGYAAFLKKCKDIYNKDRQR